VCFFSIAAVGSGASTTGVIAWPAGYTGGTTASCNNGTWSYSGESCNPPPPVGCSATTHGYFGFN
jgi:hypothetical protein